MLFKDITIIDDNFEVKTNWFVGVKDGRIAYVGGSMPDGSECELLVSQLNKKTI